MSQQDEEYTKLYNLLYSLSSKGTKNTVITPMVSLLDGSTKTNTLSIDVPIEEKHEPTPLITLISPIPSPVAQSSTQVEQVAPLTQVAPLIPKPTTESGGIPVHIDEIDELTSHIIKDQPIQPLSHNTCPACGKSFQCDKLFHQHQTKSVACINWNALADQSVHEALDKPIHLFVDDILHCTVAVKGTLSTCMFCNITFSNKGNLHKHFYSSSVCNRMAYGRLKKVIATLSALK